MFFRNPKPEIHESIEDTPPASNKQKTVFYEGRYILLSSECGQHPKVKAGSSLLNRGA